ncbi:hypothetical protein N7520_001662 [Penicillium odoratum]|uniref:uncharacterized protein n=1 Tax=Penicillium odoratum TaxID=1167516 RepID=UPI00254889F3|nr:uncharacterized protein N7520_001662 [Penicillium odoratum]KAJ5778416.1 hypothetical protein N7520_001662 [Penicillium odoratum]
MSPRGTMGWSEREEENLLPWLDENSALPWKALPDAYSEQFGVDRSVESLRGKKYHILRKQGRSNARSPGNQDRRKRSGSSRRSVVMKASQSDAPVKAAAQSDIDLWFQTILTTEPSPTDGSESMLTRGSISGMIPPYSSLDALSSLFPDRLTPALTNYFPKKSRTSSWIWGYVHRVCATGKLEL